MKTLNGYVLKLVNDYSYSHEKVSKLVGKSRPYVSNSIRILSLPIEVKKLIKTGFLTSGHARALLNCNDAVSLSNLIVKKGLSVRQTELLAKRDKIEIANNKAVPIKKDLDTKLLEDELTAHLKFKVNIHADKKKNKGKINKIAVEIKTDYNYPIDKLLNDLPFEYIRFSKYCNGLQLTQNF